MLLAAMRHDGPHLPESTDHTWERLILWASPRRLLGRDSLVRGVGLLWDDPRALEPEERRYDAAIPVTAEDVARVDRPAIVLLTMPGRYLKVRHIGPYDQLHETYRSALGTTMRAAGGELAAAPMLEVYRNSPSETPSDQLVTDLYVPIVGHS